jgi:hypothetical protein
MKQLATALFAGILALTAGQAGAKPFTFAVIGDNQPAEYRTKAQNEVFKRIIADIKLMKPAFVIQTGDHIWGYQSNADMLERMWSEYFKVAEAYKPIPVYHAPGNHDLFDNQSGKIWDRHFKKRYSAVEYGRTAVILLDGETDVNMITGEQFKWLKGRLAKYRDWDNIFIAMHKPVFRPMFNGTPYEDSASLDTHPKEYNRLIDALTGARIRMVFAGHYHQYDLDYRHGIVQYISGGGGGAVEDDPVRGFHHYLLVTVDGKKVDVQAIRISDTDWVDPVTSRTAPFMLEDFESANSQNSWTTWDQGVGSGRIAAPGGAKGMAMQIGYNFASYEWPIFIMGTERLEKWDGAKELAYRVYVPEGAKPPALLITTEVRGTEGGYGTAPQALKTGWNDISLKFADKIWNYEKGKTKQEKVGLNPANLGSITGASFMLYGYERKDAGTVYLDEVEVR